MSTPRKGPFETAQWPTRLRAHVTADQAQPRLCGYDVQGDLARFYSSSDLLLTCFSGSAPDDDVSEAFRVALVFLAPAPIAEPPAHAVRLTCLYRGTPSAQVAVAAVTLTEEARWLLERYRPFLDMLDRGELPLELPPAFRAADDDEAAAVRRLAALLPERVRPRILERGPGLHASLLAVLHTCGLRDDAALICAWTVARLAPAVAEGKGERGGRLMDYPSNTPEVRYEP